MYNTNLLWFGLTLHIQPPDAGIIRCFKAHSRCQFCLRTIQQDDTEDQDIYKIDLLEAMTMAERAWTEVSATTIKNCWNHTKLQRPRLHESQESQVIVNEFYLALFIIPKFFLCLQVLDD